VRGHHVPLVGEQVLLCSDVGSSIHASPFVAWFLMDVEAGTVAAVSKLASHSDPSVVGLVLFHQSCLAKGV